MFHKKHIVNKTTGLVEKRENKAHLCRVFNDFAEAQYYQVKYGGKIYSLQQSELENGFYEIDEDEDEDFGYTSRKQM